jgi:hypothetical protein
MRAAASSIASGSRRAGDDALDDGAVRRREREVGPLRAGPQGEQLDAVAVDRERLERQHVFAGEAKPLAARDQEAGVGRAIGPPADGGLGVLDDLLEVVEDHQAAAARSRSRGRAGRRVALAEGHVERAGDDEEHAFQRRARRGRRSRRRPANRRASLRP